MNLIQRGTTASRANRGKSVKKSIAQRIGHDSDESNRVMAGLIQENIVWQVTLKAAHHASNYLRRRGKVIRR